MRILANNFLVLVIFAIVAIVTIIIGLALSFLLEILIIRDTLHRILLYSMFPLGYLLHFMLARRFLSSTGNTVYDVSSFSVIIIITIVYLLLMKSFGFDMSGMMENPRSFFVSIVERLHIPSAYVGVAFGEKYNVNIEKLVFCISVMISLVMQYCGLFSKY